MKKILFITSIFSFFFSVVSPAQETDPFDTGINEVTVLIRFQDLNGKTLVKEPMKIIELKSGISKEFKTSPTGMVVLKGAAESVFEINFKYDLHYYTVDTKEHNGKVINLVVSYEGTAEVGRQRAERDKAEKLAREKWGSANAASFKKDLDKYSDGKYKFEDAVFLKVLNRNVQWKDKLIVCDITGSMYPYIGQVLLWYKLNYAGETSTRVCFFNDGDSKSEDKKVIGETGGLYYCDKCKVDTMTDVMVRAMAGGCGGDIPENDMEALLKASKRMEGFKELILVADNNAEVKDIVLLKDLKVPVRVIVCGSQNRIGADYLEIAYRTTGSIHTIEEDIDNIGAMKEGSEIKIGGRKYKLHKGKFFLISK